MEKRRPFPLFTCEPIYISMTASFGNFLLYSMYKCAARMIDIDSRERRVTFRGPRCGGGGSRVQCNKSVRFSTRALLPDLVKGILRNRNRIPGYNEKVGVSRTLSSGRSLFPEQFAPRIEIAPPVTLTPPLTVYISQTVVAFSPHIPRNH